MKPGEGIRLVVTGGRDYLDHRALHDVLDEIHETRGIRLLAEGGCRRKVRGADASADRFAAEWAQSREVPCLTVWAPWRRMPQGAGPWRNSLMLEMVKPHLVVATDGGDGTADCVRKARAMDVEVRIVPKS